MRLVKSKKLAYSLQSKALCQRQFGKNMATSIFLLIKQLEDVEDFRQLWLLPGNFHKLRHLPKDDMFSITLRQPYRCVMHVDIASSTITLEDICDYHGVYQKLFRK